MRLRWPFALILTALLAASRSGPSDEPALPDATRLRDLAVRFAPADLGTDAKKLPESERQALAKLVEASQLLDAVFLRQVWAGSESKLLELVGDPSPLGQARLRYFRIMKGPWSRPDQDAPFLPSVPKKPGGANFYPAGATKEDVEAWLATLSDDARKEATGFFTTIRRKPDGSFTAVPYSLEYQGELAQAADLLRQAAALTREATLRSFLEKRAQAFLTNDYYESDVAWMELQSAVEPTIGPYEVYEDEWFNYKAAFEAFIAVRDDAETKKLERFGAELQWLEDRLPVDPRYRNPKLGGLAPIKVVDVVFSSGDGNHDVQTAAYNLPNDERIVSARGTKRIMLKNTQEAKFEKVLRPIARVALASADQDRVAFDAFFTHILMHELMHGLGPHNITAGSRTTTVRQELKDTYSAMEEAKADISGLWALQQLVDKGVVDRSMERTLYGTFLASAFRSIRFGTNDAHGRGQAIQLNDLLDRGAVRVAADGTFAVDAARIKDAVAALSRQILTVEAEGSYAKARDLVDRMGVVRPEVQRVLDRLKDVPIDIEPRFVTADELTHGSSSSGRRE
jgi:Peptidase family M49